MTSAAKSSPKDAQTIAAILEDMGITEYEPRLINQLLEFTYKYVTDTIDTAMVYSAHAGKKNIDVDDIKIAVQTQLDHTLTNPPPRDLLLDVAKHKNSIPLPLIKPIGAPILPPDRYCLTSTNFKLTKRPPKWTSLTQAKPVKPNGPPNIGALVSGPKMSTVFPTVIRCKPPGSFPMVNTSSISAVAQASADALSRKRPRDDDDFDS